MKPTYARNFNEFCVNFHFFRTTSPALRTHLRIFWLRLYEFHIRLLTPTALTVLTAPTKHTMVLGFYRVENVQCTAAVNRLFNRTMSIRSINLTWNNWDAIHEQMYETSKLCSNLQHQQKFRDANVGMMVEWHFSIINLGTDF